MVSHRAETTELCRNLARANEPLVNDGHFQNAGSCQIVPNRHEAGQVRKSLVLVIITFCRHISPCPKARAWGKDAAALPPIVRWGIVPGIVLEVAMGPTCYVAAWRLCAMASALFMMAIPIACGVSDTASTSQTMPMIAAHDDLRPCRKLIHSTGQSFPSRSSKGAPSSIAISKTFLVRTPFLQS